MTEHYDGYPVLLAEHELGTGSAVDQATHALEVELQARGLRVVLAATLDDAEFAVSADAGIGAALTSKPSGRWGRARPGTASRA